MAYYTYGGHVYFKNITDITNEHHGCFILNQIHEMYITSPLKFMYEICKYLSNLFVYQML